MLSYVVGFVAFLLLFANPISQFFTPSTHQARRAPRPQLNPDLIALEEKDEWANQSILPHCPQDSYSVHVFSREPLVLYIEGFLLPEERAHLLDISEPIFEPSTVTHDGASMERDGRVRDSEVALVPRTGAVRCIESRARALQGWRDEVWVERLRVQRYGPGGHYGHHFDWSGSQGGWGRISSFMAWVDDDGGRLEGGATEFPALRRPEDPRWCRFVDCSGKGDKKGDGAGDTVDDGVADSAPTTAADGDQGPGTAFKARAGNAVYWENFRSDGTARGYDETWHAGLPVIRGSKVGLNIWSWGRIA